MLVIQDFQSSIYELLRQDTELKKMQVTPHLVVQQNLSKPFIVICIEKLDLCKAKTMFYNHVNLHINIYSRDHTQRLVTAIASRVRYIMNVPSFGIKEYTILGIKEHKALWEQGKDLLTTKLNLQYKALIEESGEEAGSE